MSTTPLLTIDQMALKLGVSKITLYRWVGQGKIPYAKLPGRLVRFDENEVTRWLNERKVTPKGVGQ
jgi:excisionase family DNA binding protein